MAKGNKLGYAKNAGKSLASAGLDAVGDLMPNLRNGIKSNKSLALNTYKKYKEDSTPFDIQKTYLYKSTKRLIDNAINDTKSGNFNNKKREAENDSFASMFDLDFDFDNSLGDNVETISMGDDTGNSFDISNISINADFDEETKFDIKATANISKANLRVTNLGFATLANQLKTINTFNNNNTLQFYSSMEEKVAKMDESMSLVGKYLTDISQNSSAANSNANRRARKSDAFEMQGIAIQDWIDLYSKGKSKQSGGMSSMFEFFIKPEIEKVVANPMGWLSKTAIKTAIPKRMKNSMKDIDSFTGMLPILAQGKFKDWGKNGNFLQKTLGNLLSLDKFKTKAGKYGYEKGKIGFDGVTKRAITHVIPGYLSRILTALTNNNGDKNLTYDFDSGKFVNSKEAKTNYKSKLENNLRSNLQSSDTTDVINKFKDEILNAAKQNGQVNTDDDISSLNERLDQMMVMMAKKGMTFGNAREAKDLGLDEDNANLVMNSYKGLKGKQQAGLEQKLASAWVDYEKMLDNFSEDTLFQSVYDRKSFSKKDSEYKKSTVNVSAKMDDTISQVGSIINKSNLSDSNKSIINKALNKANKLNADSKISKGYDTIDGGIDKLFKYFTDSNSYGTDSSPTKDGSGDLKNITSNLSDLANISMSGLALEMNSSGDSKNVKFGKSIFNGIRNGKGKNVRAKIYSKMSTALSNKPVPTDIEQQSEPSRIPIELPSLKNISFEEDTNGLRSNNEDEPVKVVVVGGNINKIGMIEDIKELSDPKNPNSANEQRARMREETKLRNELMKNNSLDGHENVTVASLSELMNPSKSGSGKGSGGIFGEIIGEVASSALMGVGGAGGLLGKLGGTLYSSKLGGKLFNTKIGSGMLDMATNGLGLKGNITGLATKGVGAAGKIAGKIPTIGLGGKLAGGAGKIAGLGGKTAGLLGGAAKFLGPIGLGLTALQGVTGGIKGFKNAGNTFGKLPGEKVTLGEKLSGGAGGILSALSLGLLDGSKMAKGIHGIGSGIGKIGKGILKYSPIGLMGSAMSKLFGKKKKNTADKDKDKEFSLSNLLMKATPVGLAATGIGKLIGMVKKKKEDEDKNPDKDSAKARRLESLKKINSVINGGPFTKIFGSRGLFHEASKMAKKSEGGIVGFFKGLFTKKTTQGDYTGSDGGSASNGGSGGGTLGFGYKGLGIHALTGRMETGSETGGKADMISSGVGDPGGKSYGAFQFSSVYNGQMGEGSVKGFVQGLKKYNMDWYNRLSSKTIGSAEFDAEWKKIAAEDYDGFYKVQEQSIIDTHYTPTANALKPIIDVDKYSDALQSEIMSLGTQFGPGGPSRNNGAYGVVNRALSGQNVASMSEREIINRIFDEKARTNTKNGQGYLNSSRVDTERKYVLEILDAAEKRVANGGPLNPSMGSIGGGSGSATGSVKAVLDIYKNDILGVKYFLGNPQNHKNGFDCSGSIQYAYEKAGYSIPGTTYVQRPVGRVINSIAEARPGDLLFSRNNEHVTMYVGDGMVYAEESKGGTFRRLGTSSSPWGTIVDGSAGIRRYIDSSGNILPEASGSDGVYKLKPGEKPGRSRNHLPKYSGGATPQGDGLTFSKNMGITSGQATKFRKEATVLGPDAEHHNYEKHSSILDVKNVLNKIKKTGRKTNEILEQIIDVVVSGYGVI